MLGEKFGDVDVAASRRALARLPRAQLPPLSPLTPTAATTTASVPAAAPAMSALLRIARVSLRRARPAASARARSSAAIPRPPAAPAVVREHDPFLAAAPAPEEVGLAPAVAARPGENLEEMGRAIFGARPHSAHQTGVKKLSGKFLGPLLDEYYAGSIDDVWRKELKLPTFTHEEVLNQDRLERRKARGKGAPKKGQGKRSKKKK